MTKIPTLKTNTEETGIKQKKNDREAYNLTNNIWRRPQHMFRDKYNHCTIARLSPCSLWPSSFSLKSIDAKMAGQQHLGLFFSSPGLLEHDFMKKTAREKRWSARVSRLECTRSPWPVKRGRPQCPVSYPDNHSASHLLKNSLRQDPPLEAILVIFGRRALIFFCLKALGKKWKMTPLLCACAVVITLETPKCRKRAPRSVEFNFFNNCDRHKRFLQNERRRADLQNVASDFLIFA